MKLSGDHRTYDASEGIEIVQPRPRPDSDIRVRERDATEGREDGYRERVDQDGDLNGGREGADELCERDTEELDEDDDEELESGSVETCSALTESDGVDHQNPVHDGTENGVWNLGNQLSNGEGLGGVDATVILADENHPLQYPQRRQLSLNDSGKNAGPENGENPRLKVTRAGPELQEAQGDDERDDYVDEQAGVDVVR